MFVVTTIALGLHAATAEGPLSGFAPEQCNSQSQASVSALIGHWRTVSNFSPSTYTLIGGRPEDIGRLYRQCQDFNANPICAAVVGDIGEIVVRATDLVETPDQAEGRLRRISGDAPPTVEELLETPAAFVIECESPGSDSRAQPRSSASRPSLRLAQDVASLRKPRVNLSEFASFTFTDDIKGDSTTQDIQLAVGRHFETENNGSWMPYFAAHRRFERSSDPDEENTLQFGLSGTWRLRAPYGAHRLTADAAYVTDDEFEASGTRLSLEFTPTLPGRFYESFTSLSFDGPIEFAWTTSLAVEHLEIDEVGEAFDGAEESATRLGGDIRFIFRGTRPVNQITPQFSLSYGLREPLESEPASYSRFTAALDFLPNADGPWSVGVSYATGEDFVSGKFSQEFVARLGVRR